MGLDHPTITFLDFDATYEEQPALVTQYPHRWLDFRALRGANLYCSAEAFERIRLTVAAATGSAVTLIGSGNYHYVALACIARLPRPFTLVVIDHHTDSCEPMLPTLISCGSWIGRALQTLPLLRRVLLIGVPEGSPLRLPERVLSRVVVFPETRPLAADAVLAQISTEEIYVSIDKDAFDRSCAVTNWDQGRLTLAAVQPLLRELAKHHLVRGVDICGELPADPVDLFRPDLQAAIRRNERTNEVLLDTLLHAHAA